MVSFQQIKEMFDDRGKVMKVLKEFKNTSKHTYIFNDGENKVVYSNLTVTLTTIGENDIKSLITYCIQNEIEHLIITGNKPFTPKTRKRQELCKYTLKLELLSNINFVHKNNKKLRYSLIKKEDLDFDTRMTVMKSNDKICIYYGYNIGDVVKIYNVCNKTVNYKVII